MVLIAQIALGVIIAVAQAATAFWSSPAGTYREHRRYCPTDSSKVCAVVVSGGALVDQPWLRFHIPLHAQVRAHSLSTPAERMRRYRCAAVTPIPQILRA